MRRGDKVVCVNDAFDDITAWGADLLGIALPVRGRVYVIRDAATCLFTGAPCVWLVGIVLPPNHYTGREMAFRATRFRPLDELKAEAEERRSAAAFKAA